MKLRFGRSALRAAGSLFSRLGLLLSAACAMALSGCMSDGQSSMAAAQPRGATVAFDSIDGPPPEQFHRLVQNLNDEAQIRRLAVISRETQSTYRVRGYLAAKVVKGQTTISWVWDVFDRDEHRALRISGEEAANSRTLGPYRDAWTAADDAMLRRIARSSVDQLAAFLTSPEAASAMTGEPQVALIGLPSSSPEAAGIFRIFPANADPVPADTADAPAAATEKIDPVPLPRRRPAPDAAVSALQTLALAAASH